MTVTGSGYDAVFQIDNADAKVVIKNGKVVAVEQSGSAGKYTMLSGPARRAARSLLRDSMSARRLRTRMIRRWI